MTTPSEAAKVLAKCGCFDPWFSKPTKELAVGWSEAFTRHGLELPDLLEAVTQHYMASPDRAMPSRIIDHARKLRRDRADRETPEDRARRELAIDMKIEQLRRELEASDDGDNT